jgi:TRAP-type C4-dicarboxylate transport system permease large subunit
MKLIRKTYGLLFFNKISLTKYIGIAFLIELLLSLLLISVVGIFIYIFDFKYTEPTQYDFSWQTFWKIVVFAPITETYLLIFTLFILRNWHFKTEGLKLAIIAAILWGLLHGIQSWPWFFAPAWSFFIYSTVYETWRLTSFKKAYFATAIPHALHNLLAYDCYGF